MKFSFYNSYHKKNKKTQVRVINSRNYTYQSIIFLIDKYFDSMGKVIDVGCGVGTIDFYLASKDFHVVGVDISSRAIELARKSKKTLGLDEVSFHQMDVNSAEFSLSDKFEYVICSEVIEHVESDRDLLKKISVLMKNGGKLILSTPLETAPLYRWGLLDEFDERVGHLRRYTTDGLVNMIESSGFRVVEVRLTEGLLRNLLYTQKKLGFLIKFIRWPVTIIVNLIDKFLIKLFGASNVYIVAVKR